MDEKPLIWTTLGNVPVEDLEYETTWEETENYVKFTETYRCKGEIVKQSAHVMVRQGFDFSGLQGEL